MIMKISEQFFLEYCIFLQKCSYNIARAHKILTLCFSQISCGINRHMDSISIVWVKNNEQDACYQEILHNLMKINPGLTSTDLGLASDGIDTICTPQKNGKDRTSKASSQIRIQRLGAYLFYRQLYLQTEWKPFMIRLSSKISIEISHITHVLQKQRLSSHYKPLVTAKTY